MAIRALLLDIDDTLVDTRHGFHVALGAVIDQWLPHLSAPARQAAIGHWTADRHGHFAAYTRGELDFLGQRHLRALDLHETFGGPALSREEFLAWDGLYTIRFASAWRLLPGVGELLAWAAGIGLRVGAVTNMPAEPQREKLARVGLTERLPLLVALDTLGVGKPDPRVFHEACRLLGVAPVEAAYVGDEPATDAAGARDAGLAGIWFDRGEDHGVGPRRPESWTSPSGVLVVRALNEIPSALGFGDGLGGE